MGKRDLSSLRVILTGASSGVGFVLAKKLAQHGCRLVLTARRKEKLSELVSQIGHEQAVIVDGDITDANLRLALLDSCVERFGGVDCIINNAGIGAIGRFDEADASRLRTVFEVNFFAAVELTRQSLPYLEQGQDALIVNIGSVLGHRAAPLKSEYSASKFALHGFSDALRAELVARSIEVLLVSPSTINSGFFDSCVEDTSGKNWKTGSAMSPEYVADKIIRAMVKRKHEIIIPFSGNLLVWLDRLLPSLANWILAKYGQ